MSSDDAKPGSRGHGDGRGSDAPIPDFFDLAGSDPELLNTGRIPDPQPGHGPVFSWMARVLTAIEARLRARGGVPLRQLIRVFWVIVAAIGLFLLVGPVINKPLDVDDIVASAKIEKVDWVARDVKLDYSIERDENGEFVAHVSEAFVAHFLNDASADVVDRTVVTEFGGHDVRFQLHSATVDGAPADAQVQRNPSMTTISLGREDGAQLDGQHEITLEYELHNLVTSQVDSAIGTTVDQWSWPLFASWPQATSGIEASFVFSPEVDDAMIRQPRAYIGWLLISATTQLEPEAQADGSVKYSFSNDQNIPPNADFWIHATFEPGTFVQPPTTPLFWVQTWGPLLPLALLGVLLLFAIAARRIVWADSAGEPWYLPRSEPIAEVPPALAARLLRRAGHAELVDALGRPTPAHATRKRRGAKAASAAGTAEAASTPEDRLRGAARAGRRAGRFGNLPSVLAQRARWGGRKDPVIEQKLRWIPDSYVRDTFLLAPVAVTLVQWGLLRQLSHQIILTVVWWPAVFVLVSTALALATMLAVAKPRPLTHEGARLVQQLKGIDVFARATRLLERGPIADPLLPYAVLFEHPRRAGDAVTELAIRETGDRDAARGWRSSHFVSPAAITALVAAIAVFAGAVVAVSAIPTPYANDRDPITRFDDLPGTFYTQLTGFDIEAELSRDADGRARLEVVERDQVDFYPDGGQVSQFAREWPASRFGQDLGIAEVSITIDGQRAPFREGDNPESGSHYAVTQLPSPLTGVHEVVVSYTLTNPVVSVRTGAEDIEQLRWTALYGFWEDEYYVEFGDFFGDKAPVRPIRLQFTIAPELVDAVRQGGWIDYDPDRDRIPGEDGNGFGPWVVENTVYRDVTDPPTRTELRVGSVHTRDDGALVAVIDVDEVESRIPAPYDGSRPAGPWEVSDEVNAELGSFELGLSSDLGVRLDFTRGTFTGPLPDTYASYRTAYAAPYAVLLLLAGLVIAVSIAVIVVAMRLGGQRRTAGASLAAVAFLAVPILAIAQCVLFFWTVGPMAGSDARIPGAMIFGALMFVAVIAQAIAAGRALAPKTERPGPPAVEASETQI